MQILMAQVGIFAVCQTTQTLHSFLERFEGVDRSIANCNIGGQDALF
jgi:hypothetical protein